MSTEEANTQPETPTTPQATPAAPPAGEGGGERKFSQAEVDAIVLAAKQKTARTTEKKVRQEFEAKPQITKEPETKTEAKTDTGSEDRISQIEKQLADAAKKNAFHEFLDEHQLSLDRKQKEIMLDLFNPADPEAFLEKVSAFGLGKKEPPKAEAASEKALPSAPSVAQPRPAMRDPGGPNGSPDGSDNIHPKYWSKDTIQKLATEIDPKTGKSMLITRIERYRDSLPGGGGPFRRHMR